MPAPVLALGANAVDSVLRLPATPAPEGPHAKLRINSRTRSAGGQSATAMCGVRALGHEATYVGALGSDDNAQFLRQELLARGVDLSHAVTRDAPNAAAVILIDDTSGERIVLWDRDERLALADDEIPADAIRGAAVLEVDDVDMRASLRAAAIARDANVPITSDIEGTSPGTDALVRAVTYPIFAESAVVLLTGERDVERGLRQLRALNPGPLVVTLGDRGAAVLDGDRFLTVPGFRVAAVDTTGAGDHFRAGFMHGVIQGWPIADILRFANATAAVSCTRRGAIASAPTLDEVQRLLRG
jgi:sulfofructose kinase